MMKEFLLLSGKNLARRKLRSWLTMIGIIISIGIIFILVSLSLGLESAIQEQFRQLGTDKFFIEPKGLIGGPGTGGAVRLSPEDVEAIERVSGVHQVTYWTIASAEVTFAGRNRYVGVASLDLETVDVYYETGFVKPEQGRLLEKGDSNRVMIGSQYADVAFIGRAVEVGDKIEIQDRDFTVRGVLKSVGNPIDDRTIYMSVGDFQTTFPDIGDRVDSIVVQVDEGEDLQIVAERVEKKLQSHRNVDEDTQDFIIRTPEELLATFGSILNILTGFLLGVAAISLLVGGIGITNTMYTSVLERTKEIGVMKAVGATNKTVMMIFTLESGLLGLLGGLVGVLIGIAVGKGIEYLAVVQFGIAYLQVATPAYLVIGCLVFSFFIGALSGAWPSWRATKIKPVEALRYE